MGLSILPKFCIKLITQRTGEDVVSKKGGSHGYFSGIDPTTFIVYGCGIEEKGKVIDTIRQIDIAPYVMHLLGIDYKFADGELPQALLE